jgi:hypothetical protein
LLGFRNKSTYFDQKQRAFRHLGYAFDMHTSQVATSRVKSEILQTICHQYETRTPQKLVLRLSVFALHAIVGIVVRDNRYMDYDVYKAINGNIHFSVKKILKIKIIFS